jgi:tRNA U34 5-methylaminomethyl-2-thiouridine-forming methyltransferase MnmC
MNVPTTKSPPVLAPKDHHWQQTEDGSWTIYSEKFQEAAHSTHGAIAETKLRFLEGCQLENRWLNQKHINFKIFEVGFGLGIGAIETLQLWSNLSMPVNIEFVSCEIDEELILWCIKNHKEIFANHYPSELLDLFKNLKKDSSHLFYYSDIKNKFHLKIFVGDILNHQNILKNNYQNCFNAIFQDAYSPKKNPTLWTLDWFEFLKNISAPDCILSTYSSSVSVRKNLMDAGFTIENGPGFGKKKSSTKAYLKS